jgi:hypothetical protein
MAVYHAGQARRGRDSKASKKVRLLHFCVATIKEKTNSMESGHYEGIQPLIKSGKLVAGGKSIVFLQRYSAARMLRANTIWHRLEASSKAIR